MRAVLVGAVAAVLALVPGCEVDCLDGQSVVIKLPEISAGLADRPTNFLSQTDRSSRHRVDLSKLRSSYGLNVICRTRYVLWMVERIEEVGAELNPGRFPQAEVFEEREINVIDSR